ncbi:hypothetical protein ACJX0J_014002, partial [Zea mays]
GYLMQAHFLQYYILLWITMYILIYVNVITIARSSNEQNNFRLKEREIRAQERFAVIPMWPEGVPTAASVNSFIDGHNLAEQFNQFFLTLMIQIALGLLSHFITKCHRNLDLVTMFMIFFMLALKL